jgi:hypothetical protein
MIFIEFLLQLLIFSNSTTGNKILMGSGKNGQLPSGAGIGAPLSAPTRAPVTDLLYVGVSLHTKDQ